MTGDGIFLIHDDGRLIEMRSDPYATEDLLQGFLGSYPSVLPGARINPAAPRRWLLVSREMGVPREEGGYDQWSLDHLFLDQDAVPTIIEVKRSSDTRIRREVVGQMLDYAASGVRYWPIEKLRARFEATALEQGRDADAALQDFLDPDGDIEGFWQKVESNLRTGVIRMVFVADKIPAELQRIVEFLNEQMRPAEVLAVEVQQYRGDGVTTLVPRLVGATAAAQQLKGNQDHRSFDEVLATSSPVLRDFDLKMCEWAARGGWPVVQTHRARQVKNLDGKTLLQLYLDDERLEFNLTGLTAPIQESLAAQLEGVAGLKLTRKYPYVPVAPLVQHWTDVVEQILPSYVQARNDRWAAEAASSTSV